MILRGSGIWELQARTCLWVMRGDGGHEGFKVQESELQGFEGLGAWGAVLVLLSPFSCREPSGFHGSRLFPQAGEPEALPRAVVEP